VAGKVAGNHWDKIQGMNIHGQMAATPMASTVLEHKRWDGCSSTSTPDQILPGFYGLVQD